MSNPVLLFNNVLKLGSGLTATSEVAGYPVENVYDWRPGTPYRWRATSTASQTITVSGLTAGTKVDCLFVAGHNLSGCSVTAAGQALGTVPSNNFWMKSFTEQTGTTFSVVISGASVASQVGVLVLGKALAFPRGLEPSWDVYGEEPVTEWNVSEGGMFLGANYLYTIKRLTISYQEPGFSTTEFWTPASGLGFDDDFKPHARQYPFAFGWNLDTDPEGWLARLEGGFKNPFFATTSRRTLAMPIVAYREA